MDAFIVQLACISATNGKIKSPCQDSESICASGDCRKKGKKFYKGSDFGAIQIQADESFVKTGDMSEQQTSMCQNVHLESHAFLFVHAVHMSKPRIHGRDVHR